MSLLLGDGDLFRIGDDVVVASPADENVLAQTARQPVVPGGAGQMVAHGFRTRLMARMRPAEWAFLRNGKFTLDSRPKAKGDL